MGIVLGAAAGVGLSAGGQGALILLLRLREYTVLLGWLALAALIGAVLLGLARSALRALLVTVLLVVGLSALFVVGFAMTRSGGSAKAVKIESAPGRGERHLRVTAGEGFLDPVWCVYVHQGDSPWERRWRVGCFNGDSEGNALVETVWTAPDRQFA
ncbi:hypothetical protein [Streptomyces sp. NPDC091268]|uniref:hypothetical protein n=1 Tax=Streptomyces sp. NPDC091268 TaxID=3365979 RepID=UPI0038176872